MERRCIISLIKTFFLFKKLIHSQGTAILTSLQCPETCSQQESVSIFSAFSFLLLGIFSSLCTLKYYVGHATSSWLINVRYYLLTSSWGTWRPNPPTTPQPPSSFPGQLSQLIGISYWQNDHVKLFLAGPGRQKTTIIFTFLYSYLLFLELVWASFCSLVKCVNWPNPHFFQNFF